MQDFYQFLYKVIEKVYNLAMEYIVKGHAETVALGKDLGSRLKGGETILLNGNLGAGKTTFTKGIALALGITEPITSPTFTILNEYEGNLNLYHFDMYRLGKGEDEDLGFYEYYDNIDAVCVVEWNISLFEFSKVICVDIEYIDDETRRISIYENFRN